MAAVGSKPSISIFHNFYFFSWSNATGHPLCLSVDFTNIWPIISIKKILRLNLVSPLEPQTVCETSYLHPATILNKLPHTTKMNINGHWETSFELNSSIKCFQISLFSFHFGKLRFWSYMVLTRQQRYVMTPSNRQAYNFSMNHKKNQIRKHVIVQ